MMVGCSPPEGEEALWDHLHREAEEALWDLHHREAEEDPRFPRLEAEEEGRWDHREEEEDPRFLQGKQDCSLQKAEARQEASSTNLPTAVRRAVPLPEREGEAEEAVRDGR